MFGIVFKLRRTSILTTGLQSNLYESKTTNTRTVSIRHDCHWSKVELNQIWDLGDSMKCKVNKRNGGLQMIKVCQVDYVHQEADLGYI